MRLDAMSRPRHEAASNAPKTTRTRMKALIRVLDHSASPPFEKPFLPIRQKKPHAEQEKNQSSRGSVSAALTLCCSA
jgi:hypothetical protein